MLKLKRLHAGDYITEDGRYKIECGTIFEECDNPHPMGRGRAYCLGGEEHAKDSWGVWDLEKDDYIDQGALHFDKFTEAKEYLEKFLAANNKGNK